MTRTLPKVPLWPRAGRSGSSAAAAWSSIVASMEASGPSSDTGAASRWLKPSGRRSDIGRLALGRLGVGRQPGRFRSALVQRAQPLHPREDAALAVVEPLLDVGREEEPAAGRADPEGDRDRVLGFVADRHGDPAHPELLGPCRGATMEADIRLARRQSLDLDLGPADPSDAEA